MPSAFGFFKNKSASHIPMVEFSSKTNNKSQPEKKPILDNDLAELKAPVNLEKRLEKFKKFTYAATLIDASQEGASVAMSIAKTGITNPLILGPTVCIKIAYAMGLNGDAVRESTEEVFDLIVKGLPQDWMETSERRREMLKEWPTLSLQNEEKARIVAFFPVFYTMFVDAVGAVYFIKSLPAEYTYLSVIPNSIWNIFAGIGMVGSSVTSIFTKGTDTYKNFRKFTLITESAKNWNKYTIASITIGGIFGLLDATEEVAKSYMTIKDQFGLRHSIGFLTVNSVIAPVNMCFSAMVMINGAHDFLTYLPQIPEEKADVFARKLLVFSFSLAMAIYVSYFMRPLTETSYHEDANDLNINDNETTDQAFFILSWMSCIQDALLGTICLYGHNPLHTFISYLMKRFGLSANNKFNDVETDDLENQWILSSEKMDDEEIYPENKPDASFLTLADGLEKTFAETDNIRPTQCVQTLFAVPPMNPTDTIFSQTTEQLTKDNHYSRRLMSIVKN